MLGSCSEDKTVPGDNDGQAIVFRVQNALPSSRAAGTTVGYMDAFVINGVVDKVEEGRKSGLTLFDHTTVSRIIGSGANVFTYSPTVYYPKGATEAEFSAFSPVSSRIAASDFQTNDNSITYSVPSPARGRLTGDVDVAPQEDLLVAYTQKDDLSGAV
ncbi:MAG: fimbrillin family protein, partial [Bacteroidales bacterium]|nr:fimbrillin family protein [Bacteroidales bacterium]